MRPPAPGIATRPHAGYGQRPTICHAYLWSTRATQACKARDKRTPKSTIRPRRMRALAKSAGWHAKQWPSKDCTDTDSGCEQFELSPAACAETQATEANGFNARAVCCACGGGSAPRLSPYTTDYGLFLQELGSSRDTLSMPRQEEMDSSARPPAIVDEPAHTPWLPFSRRPNPPPPPPRRPPPSPSPPPPLLPERPIPRLDPAARASLAQSIGTNIIKHAGGVGGGFVLGVIVIMVFSLRKQRNRRALAVGIQSIGVEMMDTRL